MSEAVFRTVKPISVQWGGKTSAGGYWLMSLVFEYQGEIVMGWMNNSNASLVHCASLIDLAIQLNDNIELIWPDKLSDDTLPRAHVVSLRYGKYVCPVY